ncbi:MAG: hypothetical protein QM697_04890 [Lachnospiraceae bacterium]
MEKNVSKQYLQYRKKVLEYTNQDMNLALENNEQVYIGVFDIPLKSNIVGFQTQTLVLLFGLNTHIYHGSGNVIVDLEKNPKVMKAMQSLLISSHQVLKSMKLITNADYYESNNVRAYLKTGKGIYFKELCGNCKEDEFLLMLMNHILRKVSESRN